MLRVLTVSDVYFPRVNGVSTSIASFRRALAEQGVEMRLLVPRYGAEEDEAGIVRLPGRRVPLDPEDRLVPWRAMHAAAAREAAQCDIVHIQTPFVAHYAGLAAARRHAKPLVLSYHTLFEAYLHHYAPFLPAAMLRAAARRFSRTQCNAVDAVIVPSTAMRDRLTAYGVCTPMEVLPTGIPLAAFADGDGARFRARAGIPPTQHMLLFVGRVAHEKNIGFLLEVAQQLRMRSVDFVFVIAGEGPALASLKLRCNQLGLEGHVRFVGYLERSRDLPDCYAAADLFVFASRTETQGLVLLEAMAAGVPVVALAEMGTRDILEPAQGALIAPDSSSAFCACVETLLGDPVRRAAMASSAREDASRWSEAQMATRAAQLYRQLAATGGTARAGLRPA